MPLFWFSRDFRRWSSVYISAGSGTSPERRIKDLSQSIWKEIATVSINREDDDHLYVSDVVVIAYATMKKIDNSSFNSLGKIQALSRPMDNTMC